MQTTVIFKEKQVPGGVQACVLRRSASVSAIFLELCSKRITQILGLRRMVVAQSSL